jgi:LAO/AO transport system kinase
MQKPARVKLTTNDYVDGIAAGDHAVLARAITLVESAKPEHQAHAHELLQLLLPLTGRSHRLGITGVPGVGKSTLIDQLGLNLIERDHKVAVLAVDPTSTRSGGSILGDKTRMTRLAHNPRAFIRPSPTSGALGGVTRRTRETMALVEAAGFDVVIVETVGVGQSETAVADMVDIFLVLLLAGGGDELQGLKRGVIEIADLIAINKADGDNIERASLAAAAYQSALGILTPASSAWRPPVLIVSAKENRGLEELWGKIAAHRQAMTASGEFTARRSMQAVQWMHALLEERLMATLKADSRVAQHLPLLESAVREGRMTPPLAVSRLLTLVGLEASTSEVS